MTPLFLSKPTFEKVGSSVKLPDDPNQWGPMVISELYKQAPVLEAFPTNLILDRIDPMKGYGFGYVEVAKPTLNPMMDPTEPLKVPVIIKDWVLQPLDIFFNGQGIGGPLTESRINEELTDPAIFDQVQSQPSNMDTSMRNMLQPPWEDVGASPRGMNSQVIEKTSSVGAKAKEMAGAFLDGASMATPIGTARLAHIYDPSAKEIVGTIGHGVASTAGTLATGKYIKDKIKGSKSEEKTASVGNTAKSIAAGIYGGAKAATPELGGSLILDGLRGQDPAFNIAAGLTQAGLSTAGILASGKYIKDKIKGSKSEEKTAETMTRRITQAVGNITGLREFSHIPEDLSLAKHYRKHELKDLAREYTGNAAQNALIGGTKAVATGVTAKVGIDKLRGKEKSASFDHLRPHHKGVDLFLQSLGFTPAPMPEKQTKKTASLLEALMGSYVDRGDIKKLASWLNTQEGVVCTHGNDIFANACVKALSLKESVDHYPAKTAGIVVKHYKWNGGPTVFVKSAAPDAFAPQEQEVPVEQAAQEVPVENQEQLQTEGETVVAPEASVMTPEQLEQEDFQQIQAFGVYKCVTMNNETVVGWVFPYMLGFDMQIMPVAVFTDGERYAFQDAIAGVSIGAGTALPSNVPSGLGLFYYIKNGRVIGFGPVNVKGQQTMSDGTTAFMVENMLDGAQAMITRVPGLSSATIMGDGQFAIPEDCRFIAFGHPVNPLISDPAEAAMMTSPMNAKMASGLLADVRVTLDGSVTLRGRPFEKLASSQTTFLTRSNAAFLLACAGVDPSYSLAKIAEARKTGGVLKIPVAREVHPPEIAFKKTAARSKYLENMKVSMFKEAAALEDPMITDTILSLNFLSPENLTMFMSYLPELQDASSKLASLTLASRLGLDDIPEAACSSSLSNLEKVIEGLKMLQLREGGV